MKRLFLLALFVWLSVLCLSSAGQRWQIKSSIRAAGKRVSLAQQKSNSTAIVNTTDSAGNATGMDPLSPPKAVGSVPDDAAPTSPTSKKVDATDEEDSFFFKMSVGLFFLCLPCAILCSFKHLCVDLNRSANYRQILSKSSTGHQFSKLSSSEEEAEELQSLEVNKRLHHTAADDWDEFLGDRKVGSSYSGAPSRYVAFESSGRRSPAGDEEVEEV